MQVILAIVIVLAVGGTGHAQYVAPPNPNGVCVSCSGDPSSGYSSNQPYVSNSAELTQIDKDNEAREKFYKAIEAQRGANVAAIAAARAKNWPLAIKLLEQAAAKYPDDPVIAANLATARAKQAEQEAERTKPIVRESRTLTALAVAIGVASSAVAVTVPRDWSALRPRIELPAMDTVRKQWRESVADLKDFLGGVAQDRALARVPGSNGVVRFAEPIQEAQETKEKYQVTVENIVKEIEGGATDAIELIAGTAGEDVTLASVRDRPRKVVQLVGQFVEERFHARIWGKTKAWGGDKL